ncbi:MAG: hypothetical protein R2828_14260 [Saprospiraceae bacterium]
MKKITPILLTLYFIFFGSPVAANTMVSDYEETLRLHLNALLGSEAFSFQSLEAELGEKSLSGIGTFLGTSNIGFKVSYQSATTLGTFEATLPSNAKVEVSNKALYQLAGQKLNKLIPEAISKGVYLEKFSFTVSKNEQKIATLELWFNCLSNWELLQSTSFAMEQVKVNFRIDHPTQKEKRALTGKITGITRINGVPLDVSGQMVAQQESLQLSAATGNLQLKGTLQSLVGRSGLQGMAIPDAMVDLQLKDGMLTIAPYQEWITIDAESNIGKVAMFVSKNQGKSKKETKKIQYLVTITTPSDFKLSRLDHKLRVMDKLPLGNQTIVLSSVEKNKKETAGIPSISQIKANINKGCNFIANLDLQKISLDKLIGVKNIIVNSVLSEKLHDVVLESNLETDLSFGAGNQLKGVVFRLQPSPQNFAISLLGVMDAQLGDDRLEFKGGVELVMTDQTLNFLAMMKGDWNNPLGARGLVMSNVAMQMGASFTTAPLLLPNLAFSGELKVGGFKGAAALAFDTRNPTKSMLAATFNEINLNDLFSIVIDKKTQQKIPDGIKDALKQIMFKEVALQVVPQPIQIVDVKYEPGFRMAGAMSVLGIKGEGRMEIDYSNGLLIQGAIDPIAVGPFKLQGAGNNKRPSLLADLRMGKSPTIAINGQVSLLGLKAQTDVAVLSNGFRFMVGGKIFNAFQGDITASGQALDQGGSMYLKVNMKTDIWNFLDEKLTGFVEESTSEAIKKLTTAQGKIKDAEGVVSGWDKEITRLREVVKKEQAADRAKYQKAYDDVENAQKKVNGLNTKINDLKKEIDGKNKITQLHEIIALEAKLKPLQIAKGTAWTALEGYQLVLKGFKQANTNPDLDPRVLSAKGSRGIALGTLKGARGSLEGLKFTLGITGKAASFILDKGTDALIKIHRVNFEGQLDVVKGGFVKFNLDIEWLGKRKDMDMSFDFHDPLRTLKDFADKLMKSE